MALGLNLVDAPAGLETAPIQRMVAALNEADLEWRRDGEINLKFVDSQTIRRLNKDYSGQDKATDVLSFSYIEGEAKQDNPEAELGDIAISLDAASQQAEAAGTALGDELATLALHGILHIHGFDHGALADRQAMDRLQADILRAAQVTYRNFGWV